MTDSQTATDLYQISGYTIEREVGRGGIAMVYLAVQESLQREVALKIMAPALTSDPNFTRRFLHEGLTVAQLNHPGIVTIYDISVVGYQHYIAMEFLKGGSLKHRIQSGLLVDQALNILHQVAAALEYAHDNGVVHRDVKPENIMFRDPSGSEAVLTDFGIAKTGSQQSNITRAGLVVGTPRYMSPEQAEGRGATTRSDIYALGVILHEMLTGRPPYKGTESMAVLYSHLNDPVPELPARYSVLQPLLEDMMAKDPEQRIPDCGTLLGRIEEHIADPETTSSVQVGSQPTHRSVRQQKPSGKRIGTVTSILAWLGVALAVVIVAGTLTWELKGTEESETGEYALPDGEPPIIITPKKIDLTMDDPQSQTTELQSDAGPEGAIDTNSLLHLAEQQLKQDRLSTPPDDNALDTYNVILKMQPGNPDAEQGLKQIAARYEELARKKLDEGKYIEADEFVHSGLAAWPQHVGLNDIQKVLAGQVPDRSAGGEIKYSANVQSLIHGAKAGNPTVQFQLALAFANGNGVARDENEAMKWFREAAKGGHAKAKYNLGLGSLFGPSPDPANAGRWMKSAAAAEYKPAYRVLGWMYTTGTGVKKSAKDAVVWSARGTKWTKPPASGEVALPWQDAFEENYRESIIEVREQKMSEPGVLK